MVFKIDDSTWTLDLRQGTKGNVYQGDPKGEDKVHTQYTTGGRRCKAMDLEARFLQGRIATGTFRRAACLVMLCRCRNARGAPNDTLRFALHPCTPPSLYPTSYLPTHDL